MRESLRPSEAGTTGPVPGNGSPRRRWRTLACGGALLAAATGLAAISAGSSAAAAPSNPSARTAGVPKLGQWTPIHALPGSNAQGGVPAVWVNAAHEGFVVWPVSFTSGSSHLTYEVATIAADGTVASPKSLFGTAHWNALEASPTLVAEGSSPLLVFQGIRNIGKKDPYQNGCVVGAVASGGSWTLENWSLSGTAMSCNGVTASAEAAESPAGVLSAAWSNTSVYYRIGASPSIPASGSDSSIHLKAWYAYYMGEASDVTGDFYIAWTVGGSSVLPEDGYFVEDASSHGSVEKAPGSGNNSIGPSINQGGRVAIAATNTHGGVFMAYCSNSSKCQVLLWRVGAKLAVTVPRSGDAILPQLAAGPEGRLWIAWVTPQDDRLFVVRTNKADTRFGPVESYKLPFPYGYNSLGLGGGQWGRLDVALNCLNNKAGLEVFTTQVMVPLTVTSAVIVNTHSNFVKFRVSDAGDGVAGAKVVVDGKGATTNVFGDATIYFPKGAPVGTYGITASGFDYLPAHGQLTIKS